MQGLVTQSQRRYAELKLSAVCHGYSSVVMIVLLEVWSVCQYPVIPGILLWRVCRWVGVSLGVNIDSESVKRPRVTTRRLYRRRYQKINVEC